MGYRGASGVAEHLAARGYDDVKAVRSAARAVAVAGMFHPAIVFLDIELPEGRRIMHLAPYYLALHGTPQTPADLAGHQCLGLYSLSLGAVLEWVFEKDGDRVAFRPAGTLAVSNAEALPDAAIAGAGIAMAFDAMAGRWIASGALRPILQDWQRRDRYPISVVYPQNRHLSAKVRAFSDFVAGLFPRRRD